MGEMYIRSPYMESVRILLTSSLRVHKFIHSYQDLNTTYTFKINTYIYNNTSVYTILYTHIYIIIKEWKKGSRFFTYNYRDFIAQSFETYRTQR